jgi:hypothetical protein
MKKSIFALIALSVVTLGLISCYSAKTPQNKVTIIETSSNVTHPALHKGDTLVFQLPSNSDGTQNYVHFNTNDHQHPCKETTIPTQKGKPSQCEITENPSAASFYLYIINTDSHDINPNDIRMMTTSRKCPPWCPGTLVVAPASGQGETPQHILPSKSDYPDVEVFIYNAGGVPDPVSAYPGQQVNWFNTGTNPAAWTLTFKDKGICEQGQTIDSSKGGYCTVKTDTPLGSHDYTITVGTMPPTTGPTSHLDIVAPPASTAAQ